MRPLAWIAIITLSATGCADDAPDAPADASAPPSCFAPPPDEGTWDVDYETGHDLADGPLLICAVSEARSQGGGGGNGEDTDSFLYDASSWGLITRFAAPVGTQPEGYISNGDDRTVTVEERATFFSRPSGVENTVSLHSFAADSPAYDYRIQVSAIESLGCQAVSPPSYVEADDGADSRQNDALSIDGDGCGAQDLCYFRVLAANPAQPAESTGAPIAIASDGAVTVAGTLAALAPAYPEDPYGDRDTYAITIGPDVTEVTIELTADNERELAVGLVRADDATTLDAMMWFDAGKTVQLSAVTPGQTYWLWIGGRDLEAATPYQLSVCGAQVTF